MPLWGFLAILGTNSINALFKAYAQPLHLLGGFFLCTLGAILLKSKPRPTTSLPKERPLLALMSGVTLTILNPLTFAAFVAFFAIFDLQASPTNPLSLWSLTLALLGGALLWWLSLILGTLWSRKRFGIPELARLNRRVGLLLILLGIYAFWNGLGTSIL